MLNYTLEQHVLSVWILRQQKNAQRKNVSRQTRAGASGFDRRKGGVRDAGRERPVGRWQWRAVAERGSAKVPTRRCGRAPLRRTRVLPWRSGNGVDDCASRGRSERGTLPRAAGPDAWCEASPLTLGRRAPVAVDRVRAQRSRRAAAQAREGRSARIHNASHDAHARGAGIAGSLPHRRHGAAKNSATTQAIPANHTSERSAAQSSTYISAYTMRIATNAIASWST